MWVIIKFDKKKLNIFSNEVKKKNWKQYRNIFA